MKHKTHKPPRSLTDLFPQVKKVVNAKKAVVVMVKEKDCADGKKLKTSECALAKATKRQFKADGVAIRMTDSFIVKGNTAIRFKTPETVKREIVSFDRHKDFAAGEYQLSPTPPQWDGPSRKRRPSDEGVKGGNHIVTKHVHRTVRVRTTKDEEA